MGSTTLSVDAKASNPAALCGETSNYKCSKHVANIDARFPVFIDPVTINGKTFERMDVPEVVTAVTEQLCRESSRPAAQKSNAAKFLLAAEATGCVTLKANIRNYCKKLIII